MKNHDFGSSFETLSSNFIVLFACGSWAKRTFYIEISTTKREKKCKIFQFNLSHLAHAVHGEIILWLGHAFLQILLKMDW